MASPHCPICIETHPLEQFRLLKCGHAFCLQALESFRKLPKPKKLCPVCRVKLHGPDDLVGIQMYLSFVTEGDVASQADASAIALDSLGVGANAEKLERAYRSIESTLSSMKGEEDEHSAVYKVWKSLHDFKKRVAPTLAEVSSLRDQLDQLQQNHGAITKERDAQGVSIGCLQRVLASLERKKLEDEKVLDGALAAGEAATRETMELRGQTAELRAKLDKFQTENEALKSQVLKLTEDNRRYRTRAQKLRAMENDHKKQIDHLELQLAAQLRSQEETLDDLRFLDTDPDDYATPHSPLSTQDVISFHLDSEVPSSPTTPQPTTLSPSRKHRLFSSDWNLSTAKSTRMGIGRSASDVLDLDPRGRPRKPVATGVRRRVRLDGGLKR